MNLSNENELILHCTQINIPQATIEKVEKLICLKLNWDKVLSFCLSKGTAPLLYHNLQRTKGNSLIPSYIIDKLKEVYVQNLARNTYISFELQRILESFHDERIDVVVLKGAALAGSVYKDLGLRVFTDLDILVRKNDLPKAEGIMRKLNYCTNEKIEIRNHYKKNHHHLAPYFHQKKSTIVEIHWNISPRLSINIDEFWERREETKIGNYKALTLCPSDMLFHLCLHLFSSGYTGNTLRGICDISETLKHYSSEINWEMFRNLIEKYNIQKEVDSILYVTNQFYGDDDNPICSINSHSVDFLLVSLIQKLAFSEDKSPSVVPGSLVKAIAASQYSDKFDILKRTIFPDRITMSSRYNVHAHSYKLYYYYLCRIFELCVKYGKGVLVTLFMKSEKNEIFSSSTSFHK